MTFKAMEGKSEVYGVRTTDIKDSNPRDLRLSPLRLPYTSESRGA
jgi:hypothetical protein